MLASLTESGDKCSLFVMINGLTQAALVFEKSRNAQTMAILIKNSFEPTFLRRISWSKSTLVCSFLPN